jgi:hypothetical protein
VGAEKVGENLEKIGGTVIEKFSVFGEKAG